MLESLKNRGYTPKDFKVKIELERLDQGGRLTLMDQKNGHQVSVDVIDLYEIPSAANDAFRKLANLLDQCKM